MTTKKTSRFAFVAILCLAPALAACQQSSLRIDPEFGKAIHQDVAAQIADPDAHYEGIVTPGSAGRRVGLAQKRYDTNQVVQPSTTTASSKTLGGVDNGSGGGGGAGVSGGVTQ
jgi:hypothetical protein